MADPVPPSSSPPPPVPGADSAPRERFRRYSISAVLGATLALLVILTAVAVVTPLLILGRQTTVSLLRDRGELLLGQIELRVRQQMQPTANQLAFIADVLGRPGPTQFVGPRIADLLTGALAATPQIASLSFVDENYLSVTATRSEEGVDIQTANIEYDPLVAMGLTRLGGWWSDLVRGPGNDILVVRQHSVWREGRFHGMLFARVSARQLSGVLAAVQPGLEGGSFILYDHDYVLAHPSLTRAFPDQGPAQPLPRVDQVGDPVLAAIWSEPTELPLLGRGTGAIHAVQVGDYRWLFISRTLYGYGDKPWLIGTYFRAVDALAELRQLAFAALGAVLALILAIFAALWVGRWLARPITQLAMAARQIRGLRFSSMPELPRSPLRELDDQARAFNDMLGALRWFESYVPRKLVRRLALRRDRGPLPSVEREVTVLFTDIVGFTPMSERMTAVDTALLLNRHFELVTKAIEEEDGTVDKFIGDAAMAFWGAPGRRADHAERALRAASAIARSIWHDNRRRIASGRMPIRVRIGIHTGPAIIGNIGSIGRINYTIVGDTVNVAQRIEQAGRRFMTGGSLEVVVLFSAATERHLNPAIERVSVGTFALRGVAKPMPLFQLILPPVIPRLAIQPAET
jgi:class 3 adenylate cyclase